MRLRLRWIGRLRRGKKSQKKHRHHRKSLFHVELHPPFHGGNASSNLAGDAKNQGLKF